MIFFCGLLLFWGLFLLCLDTFLPYIICSTGYSTLHYFSVRFDSCPVSHTVQTVTGLLLVRLTMPDSAHLTLQGRGGRKCPRDIFLLLLLLKSILLTCRVSFYYFKHFSPHSHSKLSFNVNKTGCLQ